MTWQTADCAQWWPICLSMAESIARTPAECRVIEWLGEAVGGGTTAVDRRPQDRMHVAHELLDCDAADS